MTRPALVGYVEVEVDGVRITLNPREARIRDDVTGSPNLVRSLAFIRAMRAAIAAIDANKAQP